jgi:hypothetical protein
MTWGGVDVLGVVVGIDISPSHHCTVGGCQPPSLDRLTHIGHSLHR